MCALRLFLVYAAIAAFALIHSCSVRATESAHQGAVAANWCNYLGPDCQPYGLSPKGYIVFQYLTSPESMPSKHRSIASHELSTVETDVAAGDPATCARGRDIAKAMRGSPSPDMKRRGRELFDLIGEKCD
jgi:hypothetical protein|nr:MAG TPA: hypothetical protein [Caudoviricetes sp.]